ncbi:hypothetical protein AAFF_G00278720 [Aldrovandia affinis]|uniref:Uncharacterized protein n=1 Tax=Aldrovandia affinis TaxID=143900 RepID=A0AAD7SSB6_9TELE|nr:hypothetical protein AAFF_G00278720 [Aldrovandia affinis]
MGVITERRWQNGGFDQTCVSAGNRAQEIPPERERERMDVFSCLSTSCSRPPPCSSVRPSQSLTLLCRDLLPKLLTPQDARAGRLSADAPLLLGVCADGAQTDGRISGRGPGPDDPSEAPAAL